MGDIGLRKTYFHRLRGQLKRVLDHNVHPLDHHAAKEIMIRAEEIWEKYEEVQSRLITTALDDAAFETQFKEGTKVEEVYFELRSKLRPLIESLDPSLGKPPTTAAPKIKLPSIELPVFEGNIAEWTSFKDLFSAAVGNMDQLTPAQKLQYLKSSLKGEPASLVRSLATTDSNYSAAWKILNERYENEREIVHTLINSLINAKPVKSENAIELQALLDGMTECIRALEVLKRPIDKWNDFLVVLLLNKLDTTTRREWAIRQTGTNLPTFNDLVVFLRAHIRGIQSSEGNKSNADKKNTRPVKVNLAATGTKSCLICSAAHQQFQCSDFKRKSVTERKELAVKLKLCYNCLSSDHPVKSCTWKGSCKKCGKRHHTLLHIERGDRTSSGSGGGESDSSTTSKPTETKSTPQADGTSINSNHVKANSRGVLMTAVVMVKDKFGQLQPCRVFVDPGSEAEFISEGCVNRLGLSRQASEVMVTGFGGAMVGKSRGIVQATLHSRYNQSNKISVKMLVLPKLTGIMPAVELKGNRWNHLSGLELADPRWYCPGPIDIVIGISHYHEVKLSGRCDSKTNNSPVAWESIFGWIVAGPCQSLETNTVSTCHVSVDPVTAALKRFWEIEEIPVVRELSKEEAECEQFFQDTISRNDSGRYIPRIPFNDRKNELGRTRAAAIKRLLQVERKMKKNEDFKNQYTQFMREYESMGHMKKLPPGVEAEVVGKTAHLPHHGVINESSTTTKLRVVFDGSAASSTGVSLNDTMMVGATIQDELYNLLLRFRTYPVVIKADIAKMFRQFYLTEEDADYHRIVWRESTDEEIADYKLMTVTYGTACAPFLATRCLHQLAIDCQHDFPNASRVFRENTYVDDILVGGSSSEEAIALYKELCNAAATACLSLRKWTSNSEDVLACIPEDMRECEPHSFDEDKTIKALGVQWHPLNDVFKFKGVKFQHSHGITKRKILSDAAKVFDPLGLISCVSVRAKMLLQEVWKLECDWDDLVPEHVQQAWMEYKEDLLQLTYLSIPRRLIFYPERYELHGFSDSSERALGSIVYIRNIAENGTITVSFVTSKTRVAPVKLVTLPRLELEAALMLAKLVKRVVDCLQLKCDIYLWCDSTIALTWISGESHRWQTFVANRVSKIQRLVERHCWKHVPGKDNPADLASRGVKAVELLQNDFWWKGPSWLSEPGIPEFKQPLVNGDLEEKKRTVLTNHVSTNLDVVQRMSTLLRLKRVMAFVLRFIGNIRVSQHQRGSGPLTATELNTAFMVVVKAVQVEFFKDDYKLLKKGKPVAASSKLKSLYPYLDNQGIMRVGGRLDKASLPESRKHQIIIPGSSHLTVLLIRHTHISLLHSGFQLTWSRLQSEYWVVNGRDKVRHFIRSCVICRRYRAKAAQQLMGTLPNPRVTPCRPFLHTGVDYAGPFVLKNPVGRVPKTYKGYLCLFVCMSTKAIHLEPVSSLTTEGFLESFRRFVSRRGLCAHMYSDCGTNFVGADRELRAIISSEDGRSRIATEMGSRGIEWHFNPPSAPHHGGLWEAGVKSAKHHLRRVIGNNALTYEQFHTILSQVEAVLNSRPLYAASSDPGDVEALTPGHFLIGEPLVAVPVSNFEDIPRNRLTQFQLQQQRVQHFWRRWSAEYLNTLQQRTKWRWQSENVKCGDLVLVVEESSPGQWKLGRIIEIKKGDDGLVRVATVKTMSGTFSRSISKLIPLINSD